MRKLLFSVLVAAATMTAWGQAPRNQGDAEGAFDAKKTEALFAGTGWVFHTMYPPWEASVTFNRDGRIVYKGEEGWQNTFSGKWMPSGALAVTVNNTAICEFSPDRKRLYVTDPEKKRLAVLYRGTKLPSLDAETAKILWKPDTVWAAQIEGRRATIAFEAEARLAVINNVKEGKVEYGIMNMYGGHEIEILYDDGRWETPYLGSDERAILLTQDEKGGWVLRNYYHEFRPEPVQPGDVLPPQKISRERSALKGTSWCTFDGKTAKLRSLSFASNGVATDSAFQGQRGEWNPYENDTVRYKIGDHTRKLTVNMNQKRLMREDGDVREIWFQGGQPPRLGLVETKKMKETLADKSKAWFNWDGGKKTVYAFDDKSGNVSITQEDARPKTVRWDVLCDGCIRIGNEVFMLEGDTLERVEPRLTLKQEPNL